jgi:NAD(P) transhydrogenase subunit alpha
MSFRGLTLGIPKEILAGERRVATTPEFVRKMVSEGATVVVETGAGHITFFLIFLLYG